MGLVCIQNSSLLVYSKSQKVSASYCLAFQHSRGKNQPVGGLVFVLVLVLVNSMQVCLVFWIPNVKHFCLSPDIIRNCSV